MIHRVSLIEACGAGLVGAVDFLIELDTTDLDACGVAYSDYGTRFARDWHQIFFLDPEGVIVEVHAVQPKS